MISVRCLVDNTAQFNSHLWGEHGVSFAIETPAGKILFDTGQSGEVLLHNAARMGIRLEEFSALAISHAHFDHTGGLESFLTSARPGIRLFASPNLFQERFERVGDQTQSIGLRLTRDQLSQRVDLRLSAEPAEILPGVWTTGRITNRSEFEGRSAQHFIQDHGEWLPDPYQDDLSLVLETRDGLVVVCGCCHAGLLNTLDHIRRVFNHRFLAVIGGTHLVSAAPETIAHAVNVLMQDYNGQALNLYPNHCTGERAYLALAQAFGEHVAPFHAGSVLNFA